MPSEARKAFDKNLIDIERLMKLHQQVGGKLPGRRYGLEVLNKSAIVLITSFWEAYCEDIAAEGLAHIVKHAKSADALPKEMKKQIAKELTADKNELALWAVADEGWRLVLESRLARLQEQRNRRLNTPKSAEIDDLFMSALGLTNISDSWKWARKMTSKRARSKLDKYVTLRGSIAHRGISLKGVTKGEVDDYYDFVKQLAAKTGGEVNSHVKTITGRPLWTT